MNLNLLLLNKKTWSLLFLVLTFSFVNAANITSAGSGNWTDGTTWVGGVAPTAADNVIIAAGHIVTVTVSTSIINLNLNSTTRKLIINNSQILTITGTFLNSGTTTNGVNGPGTLLFTGTASFGVLTPTGVLPNVVVGNGASNNTVTVGVSTSLNNLNVNIGATISLGIRTNSAFFFFFLTSIPTVVS